MTPARCRLMPFVALSLAVWVGSGCRVFRETAGFYPVDVDAREQTAVWEGLLARPAWQLASEWTPLDEHPLLAEGVAAPPERRWMLLPARQRLALLNRRTSAESQADKSALWQLAQRHDMVGWNAAVLIAQVSPVHARSLEPTLRELVADPPGWKVGTALPKGWDKVLRQGRQPVPERLRCAAAEAWCLVLQATSKVGEQNVEERCAAAGELLLDRRLPPAVRGELWRGLSFGIRPVRLHGLSESLRPEAEQVHPDLRRAALEACLRYAIAHATELRDHSDRNPPPPASDADSPLRSLRDVWGDFFPPEVWSFETAETGVLRQRVGEMLAVLGPPPALEVLRRQTDDQDPAVRQAALIGLGMLGQPEARQVLVKQAESHEDLGRAAAVRGLAFYGPQVLTPYLQDKQAAVRTAAVRGLARYPTHETGRALRNMLTDRSVEVQLAVVAGTSQWPSEIALPLLLDSLAEGVLKVRLQALRQLSERRSERVDFPVTADAHQRAQGVVELTRRWAIVDPALARFEELAAGQGSRARELRLDELEQGFRQWRGSGDPVDRLEAWADGLSSDDVALLETLAQRLRDDDREQFLQHVLARRSSVFEALNRLASADVSVRRRAAQQLVTCAHPLNDLALQRLHAALRREQDQLVWRSSMLAIRGNGSDDAASIVLLAINSTWPDIRTLGCEWVGQQSRYASAPWLLPLLQDENRGVQLAAIEAAGQCRNPVVLNGTPAGEGKPLPGLRGLLTSAQGQVRHAAVVSMSRLGDEQGMQELIRLSRGEGIVQRVAVLKAMGDSQQSRFVEPLIELLWTETQYAAKAAALRSLQQLVPLEEHPAGLDRATLEQAVALWGAWWQARQGLPASGGR